MIAAIRTLGQAVGCCKPTILAVVACMAYNTMLAAEARVAPDTTARCAHLWLPRHYFAGMHIPDLIHGLSNTLPAWIGRYYCIPDVVYIRSTFHKITVPVTAPASPDRLVNMFTSISGWSKLNASSNDTLSLN